MELKAEETRTRIELNNLQIARDLLPDGVLDYIQTHSLYRNP